MFYMIKKIYLYLLFFVILFNGMCFGQDKQSRKAVKLAEKELKTTQAFEKTKILVDSGSFDFEADWAYPLNTARISLIGNINRLRFENDSVQASLPYFGTRYFGGMDNAGMQFNSELRDYEVDFDNAKKRVLISFTAINKNDRFQINMEIESDGSGFLYVASNKRHNSTYSGRITTIQTN